MSEKSEPKKKTALNIMIDDADYNFIKQEAEEMGVPLAGYVRMMIKEKIKQKKTDI